MSVSVVYGWERCWPRTAAGDLEPNDHWPKGGCGRIIQCPSVKGWSKSPDNGQELEWVLPTMLILAFMLLATLLLFLLLLLLLLLSFMLPIRRIIKAEDSLIAIEWEERWPMIFSGKWPKHNYHQHDNEHHHNDGVEVDNKVQNKLKVHQVWKSTRMQLILNVPSNFIINFIMSMTISEL